MSCIYNSRCLSELETWLSPTSVTNIDVTRLAMAAKIWVPSFVKIVQKMFYIEIEWYIDPRKGYNDVIFE